MANPKLKLFVGAWHLLEQRMGFGNPTLGGFKTMPEALFEVAKLNEELEDKYGIVLAVSAHWWHELTVMSGEPKIGYSAKYNNPRSIRLDQWMDGVQSGHYPLIGRIIPPGFGIPGSDDGAFINPDFIRRQLSHDMMVHSFAKSRLVQNEGVGEGKVIYWTGPDGIEWKRLVRGEDILLSHDLNPKLIEWEMIINGLADAIKEAIEEGYGPELLIESKSGGDPCYLDVMTDTLLEILGIKQINERVGADVSEWQGELCHSRGGGQRFVDAMRQAIEGGVFGGKIHLNSGALGSQNFAEMLSKPGGTRMSLFQQYVDPDFLPGEGVPEWIDDQVQTIALGKEWSAKNELPFEVEFDARFARYPDTIGALRKSVEWTIEQFNAD